MGGCLQKTLAFIGGAVVLIIALAVIAYIVADVDTEQSGQAIQNEQLERAVPTWTPTTAPSSSQETTVPQRKETPPQPAQITPTPTPLPAPTTDPNRGIVFGEPIVFSEGGFSEIAVMARNTTDLVKSFTVKATFKQGDQIVATAIGAVNDMLPGQELPVMLLATTDLGAYDYVRVDVDVMIQEARTTASAEAIQRIRFGPVTVMQEAGFASAEVEVTNEDDALHSFTVIAWWMQDGKLTAVASGAVNDLAPGQTKTATLLITGIVSDEPAHVAIDTLIQ